MQIVLAALVVLFLPGATWLAWFPGPGRDPIERLAEALALSLSLTALGGLGLYMLGWQITLLWVFVFYAAWFVLLMLGWWRKGLPRLPLPPGWAGLLVVAVVAWRFYQARDLALPAWVDSVHHVLVVQKIIQSGGIPVSLGPELPVPFFYHYSFHLVAALFSRMGGIEPYRAVLWVGQILSVGVALSVYRLGKAVWNDPRRAGLAALLCAFAFQMPAYYLTWGRYTLLTGLVVLPAAIAEILDAEKTGAYRFVVYRENPFRAGFISSAGLLARASAATVILSAGVALSHYLALALLGLFVLVSMLLLLLECWRDGRRVLFRGALYCAVPAGLGVLLASPWLWRVLQFGQRFAGVQFGGTVFSASEGSWNYLLFLVGPLRNYLLLDLAGMGMLLALAHKQSEERRLALWGLILALASLPLGIQLGPFRNDHTAIVLFLPGALLAAHLLITAGEALARFRPQISAWAFSGVLSAGLIGWGLFATANILTPSLVFATQADLAAVRWVSENTPPDARFFINTTLWQPGSYRGVDGGYWLLTLTGRRSILPPAMYGYGSHAFIREINEIAAKAAQITGCGDDFWKLVRQAGLTHLYLKEGQGSLQPGAVAGCKGVRQVYGHDGVFVYEVGAGE